MTREARFWWWRRWGACALAGVCCWLCQFWPAYQEERQAAQKVQAMEQQEMSLMNSGAAGEVATEHAGVMAPSSHIHRPDSGLGSGQPETSTRAPGDVAALVQWHALMRQHQVSGWQGRVLASASPPAETTSASAGPGSIWRLEGPATYAQGIAVLEALARDFPDALLLHVQARHSQPGHTLHWLVELRWTSDGLKRVPPVAWPLARGIATDPFSPDRLKPVPDAAPGPSTPAGAVVHVLPQVSVRALRLAGVVSGGLERQALVTIAAPAVATTAVANPVAWPVPAWQALREGQVVGEERARVRSIESRRVVLESGEQVAAGGTALSVVLELASAASPFTQLSGRLQP